MSSLILPRRGIWTSQPHVHPVGDWSNSLTQNLVAAFDFSTPGVLLDAVTGMVAENKGVVWSKTPHGVGITANTAGIRIPWSLGFTSEDISITIIEHRPSAPSSWFFVCDNRESGVGYINGTGDVISAPSGSVTYPGRKVTTFCKSEFYQNGIKTSAAIGTGLVPAAGVRFFGRYTDAEPYNNSVIYALLIHRRNISQQEHNEIYLRRRQIFAPRETRLFVPVGGGGSVNANASGALSAVSVAAPSASASGSASATGACAAITLSAPTATASAGGSASASGSFASLSISSATATATATKSASASGAFAAISLSAPNATATGTTAGNAIATAAPAQITISHATAIAIGSAVASGGYQSIGITATTGSASVGNGNATASGAWAAISITAPAAYASSGFIRAPAGSGPTVIQAGSYRPRQSATSRPSNTGGRRY